jgi:hypothetical protein
VGAAPYRLEALGVISGLLSGFTGDGLAAELALRVDMRSPHRLAPEDVDAAVASSRAYAQSSIYEPLEKFAFDGKRAFPRYMHPAGTRFDVTTRLSTADRYGARYHAFGESFTEPEVREKLLAFLLKERALRASPAGYKEAVRALDAEAKAMRLHEFYRWNACVTADMALGDGKLEKTSLNHYERQRVNSLPAVFTAAAEPDASDIVLQDDVAPQLGRFVVYAGRGKHLHIDREYVLGHLHAMTANSKRQAYIYKKVWAFGPWALLKGGKELVDAPGTGDNAPLHRQHLKNACRDAHHVIMMAGKNLGSPDDVLESMEEFNVLQRFLDPNEKLQLSVVQNHETSCFGLAAFRDRDRNDEDLAKHETINALVSKLCELTDIPMDELRADVESRVRVHTVYTLLYAGLKLFPDRAAAAEDLEEVLRDTQGASLLGLLEGLNLGRVCEVMETLRIGPLANAVATVRARISRTSAGGDAGDVLRVRALNMLKPNMKEAKAGMRRTLCSEFESRSADAPRSVLDDGITEAFTTFENAMQEHLAADGAAVRLAHTAWRRARGRFIGDANREKALTALAAAPQQAVAGPRGMDLHNLLCSFSLPPAVVDELLADVDSALSACEDACCTLVNAQLLALARGDEQQALVRRLIEQEFALR